MSLGIKVILVYLGVTIVFALPILAHPAVQFGPVLLTGFPAAIIGLLSLAAMISIFYGIIKRFKWARKLFIGYYLSFGVLLPTFNLIFLKLNPSIFDDYYRDTLKLQTLPDHQAIFNMIVHESILGWAMIAAMSFYLLRKRDYFTK